MKADHGLPPATFTLINGVLTQFSEVERAVLFGSRAKGTHKPGSDIDLALTGETLDWRIIGRIYDELDDLFLPYSFSLIQLNGDTDTDVAAHIERVGITLYKREVIASPAGS